MSPALNFHVNASWVLGQHGTVEGDPAAKRIEFSAPPEFQGEPGFWSPEHFLLAAVASCFVTTFRAIARISKFEPVSLDLSAEGIVEKGEGGFAFTQIILKPRLMIHQESERERGLRLLEKTEHSCLISRSLKATVTMEANVAVADMEMADIT